MTKKQKLAIQILRKEAEEIIKHIESFENKTNYKFNKTQWGNKRHYEGVLRVCEIMERN